MKKIGLRTYEVTAADSPIEVVIAARNLQACRAVVGEVRVVKDGAPVGTVALTIVEDPAALTTSYAIPLDGQAPPREMVQTIHAWFQAKPPQNSRYDITITSNTNDVEATTISRPTIDPGIAVLVFKLR